MTEGYYVVAELTADPASLKELERVLTLADEVIRFKILALPEKTARPAAKPSREVRGAKEAVPAETGTETEAAPAAQAEPAPASGAA